MTRESITEQHFAQLQDILVLIRPTIGERPRDCHYACVHSGRLRVASLTFSIKNRAHHLDR